ncbi:MAG: glycosyltransferase family 4 protein, partial [Caldilineaceae bacterium]|nr:glycosyltransferase family 4 protein [Caldilineaceae bacterium]
GTPCYVRAFGGSLDRYYQSRPAPWQRLFRAALAKTQGLIVETELLHRYFVGLLGDKVHYVPGYRPIRNDDTAWSQQPCNRGEPLRTVFIGHIREEKGVFDLLSSLQQAAATRVAVQCDLFGPIYDADSHRFQQALAQTPNAVYRGLLEPEQVIPHLRHYDALVFPTHYPGEGHPGVIIEAMMAGKPVVTTRFRSIPEIIHDGRNGLLVEPNNASQLAETFCTLTADRTLLMKLGQCNWEMRTQFSAAHQVPRLLTPLGIQL